MALLGLEETDEVCHHEAHVCSAAFTQDSSSHPMLL